MPATTSLRFDYCMEKFHENGQEFTDENMNHEIEDRLFITSEWLQKSDYIYAECMEPVSQFLLGIGKLTGTEPAQCFQSIRSVSAGRSHRAYGNHAC